MSLKDRSLCKSLLNKNLHAVVSRGLRGRRTGRGLGIVEGLEVRGRGPGLFTYSLNPNLEASWERGQGT